MVRLQLRKASRVGRWLRRFGILGSVEASFQRVIVDVRLPFDVSFEVVDVQRPGGRFAWRGVRIAEVPGGNPSRGSVLSSFSAMIRLPPCFGK